MELRLKPPPDLRAVVRADKSHAALDETLMWSYDPLSYGSPQDSHGRRPYWRPILVGEEADKANEALRRIARTVMTREAGRKDVATGLAGVALFLAYMHEAYPTDRWGEAALQSLSNAMHADFSEDRWDSLGSGVTGVAWAVAHLRRVFPELDRRLELTLQHVLLDRTKRPPWQGVYDLTDGLSGYGVYALEAIANSPALDVLVEQIVERMADTALRVAQGITWWNAPQNLDAERRAIYPLGCHNLGVPHGVPGAIAFLAQASLLPRSHKRARILLDGAVQWLLAQRKSTPYGSCFNSIIALGGKPNDSHSSPLAWCYGDLGLAAALYWAAVTVREEEWTKEALDVARRAAHRALAAKCVKEPGLCHGTAGVAHILNRFYQATKDDLFLVTARTWLQHTLSFYDSGASESAGFHFPENYHTPTDASSADPVGLFGGVSGIGLTLLSATRDRVPHWDRIMAVAIPPTD